SYAESGDLRFAAELLRHAVFANPDDGAAREDLAGVYERLGYGSENATWRSFYLSGALELREGVKPPAVGDLGASMAGALTIDQLFDSLAIRVNGPRAANETLVIDWHFTDAMANVRLSLSNGALIQTVNPRAKAAVDLTITLSKAQLLGLLAGHGLDGIEHSGDPSAIGRLVALLDHPDPAFPIVTP
ncbi:MAG: alkyl sulfatase C-terminal domain-containing protein, partial [Trebonia sp.]